MHLISEMVHVLSLVRWTTIGIGTTVVSTLRIFPIVVAVVVSAPLVGTASGIITIRTVSIRTIMSPPR